MTQGNTGIDVCHCGCWEKSEPDCFALWITDVHSHGEVTNTNEIVPAQSTANIASKANDKQQLSTAHNCNTRKQPEHNYAADGNLEDDDTKESYEPELLEKYGQSMSA